MNNTSTIIKKELYRVFSDKRLIISLFILPAIIMFAIYGLMGTLMSSVSNDIEEHVSNVVIVDSTDTFKQAISASGLESDMNVAYINANEYSANKENYSEDILSGNLDLIVVIDPEFDAKFSSYEKSGDAIPDLKLVYNSTINYSSAAYSKFSGDILPVFSSTMLTKRLGDLSLMTVYNQENEIIAKEEKMNNEFITMMLPYLITIMLFSGVMSVGLDAIAGEKERGTLASMLVSPAKRSEIVVGKLISMGIISGLSSLVYAVSMVFAFGFMSDTVTGSGIQGYGNVSFGPAQIGELIAIMLVMVFCFVSIIGCIAAISKDTKSATTLVSPLYLIIIFLAMMTMFSTGNIQPTYKYFIPIYGNALAIRDICGNELSVVNFLASLAGTAGIGVVFTALITRAFNSEKLMFNA